MVSVIQRLLNHYFNKSNVQQQNFRNTVQQSVERTDGAHPNKNVEIYTPKTNKVTYNDKSISPRLQVDRNYNLTIAENKVYSVDTDYGLINYRFNNNSNSRYVQTLYYDNQISDEKRVHLEKNRQFLTHLQTFAETGRVNIMYTARDAGEVLEGFKRLGINTEEPFTINNKPTRYRIDPSGVIHKVDIESKGMREKDWRKFGHDENTIFIIQGKEYKMDENGRLPLPEDYVHKHEQVQIINK
ncbi:hypothetical protein [Gracilibacillus thailandensis]|uniref:Uncharacterized protein n=3 Tax=Gracilibacillus thailandensis TaxID=563735 RepID=A0A6N7R6B7_9BACI|nr:hypothetical protein [Gracilibacillus thailandensis]MRI68660.1 hypothetical protein [Gracilibacillus thailandensis]